MQDGLRKSLRQLAKWAIKIGPAGRESAPRYCRPAVGGAPGAAAIRYRLALPEDSRLCHGGGPRPSGPVYGDAW